MNQENCLASPIDGTVSQVGQIKNGRIFQAKGQEYTVTELLGGDAILAEKFQQSQFATLYLSPKDYHRVHMPIDGQLEEMIHIPGRLFSVNPSAVDHIPRVFARNERVVCLFDTKLGPVAVIMVGAMIVASIKTVWGGLISPPRNKTIQRKKYPQQGDDVVTLKQGDEMGSFQLGSTAILLFPADQIEFAEQIKADANINMGQLLGNIINANHQKNIEENTICL